MYNLKTLISKTVENARIEYVKFTKAHPNIDVDDDRISIIIHSAIPNLRSGNIYDLMPILNNYPEIFEIPLNEFITLSSVISQDDKLDDIIIKAVENLILMKVEEDPLICIMRNKCE